MRLSILADDNRTSMEPSVVGENADRPADVEPPETAEYLFIGPPPGSTRRHVQHAAGLAVLAAVALTTWLLTTSSKNDTGPTVLISASAPPQQSTVLPGLANSGYERGGGSARPPSIVFRVLPEQPRPVWSDGAHITSQRVRDIL